MINFWSKTFPEVQMGTKEKIGKITIQLLYHPFYRGRPNPNLKPSLTATTVKTNQKPPERKKVKNQGQKLLNFVVDDWQGRQGEVEVTSVMACSCMIMQSGGYQCRFGTIDVIFPCKYVIKQKSQYNSINKTAMQKCNLKTFVGWFGQKFGKVVNSVNVFKIGQFYWIIYYVKQLS